MSKKQKSVAWYKNAKNSDSYWVEKAKNRFAIALEKLIEKKGLNKSQFAKKINASGAYVTKMLGGNANFTIETMVKTARALDCQLHIHIAPKNHKVSWVERAPQKEKFTSKNVVSMRRSNRSIGGEVSNSIDQWERKCVHN